MYASDKDRSLEKILRFHNLTFLHATTLLDVFGKTKSLTTRKMFGQYYHALVSHAPQQYRIMAMTTSNAEDEERQFNFLKTTATQTSNHHSDNVLMNAFIRSQVRAEYQENSAPKRNKEHGIIHTHKVGLADPSRFFHFC